MILILTCEHGGNEIPNEYLSYFKNNDSILKTHQGYDLGALDVFEFLKSLANYSKYSKTSRLLIELNRSLHHKNLFSKFSKLLSNSDKETLIHSYYVPYRKDIASKIKSLYRFRETVLHIGVHSFTPILNTNKRVCDIGLLYDPSVTAEFIFSKQLKRNSQMNPSLNVRFNYPYRGTADGFTTYLRKMFRLNYLGIELEINQKFSENNEMDRMIKTTLNRSLKTTLSKPIFEY